MKWIKDNKIIREDEIGELIAVLPDSEDALRDKLIEHAPEAFAIIFSFVEDTDNGSFKPKSTYDKMKRFLEKFPKYVLEDERLQIQ